MEAVNSTSVSHSTIPSEELQEETQFADINAEEQLCVKCRQSITNSYYEAEGDIICTTCKKAMEQFMKTGTESGNFFRSLLFGIPAAILSGIIYYAITAITGYEFGLVAIVIGLVVGGAVKAGSRHRGGWRYQLLAMFLTYAAIVSTYAPYIIEGFQAGLDANEVAVMNDLSAEETSAPSPVSSDTTVSSHIPSNSFNQAEYQANVTTLAKISGTIFLMILVFISPFLAGFQNIIGLIIIGIGLYEAWAINKYSELNINGPYEMAEE